MGDLIKTGLTWLASKRMLSLSSKVSYSRASASIVVDATVGKTLFRVTNPDGFQIRSESRDYLFPVAQMGMLGLPLRGDLIRETIGGIVNVFEVTQYGGEPCFKYSDSNRQTLRVHTKFTKTEA